LPVRRSVRRARGRSFRRLCSTASRRGCSKAALHPMPAFPSRPLNKSPLHLRLKKHPALFGVPFLLVMVGASFGLQAFTQTRYDLHSQKVTQVRTPPLPPLFDVYLCSCALFIQMSREQELGLDRNRKKFDAREEYFVSLPSVFRLSHLPPFSLFFPFSF
jgi:Cytochrome c oxidase assembly protein COX16